MVLIQLLLVIPVHLRIYVKKLSFLQINLKSYLYRKLYDFKIELTLSSLAQQKSLKKLHISYMMIHLENK